MNNSIIRIDVGEEMTYIEVPPENYAEVSAAFDDAFRDWEETYLTEIRPQKICSAAKIKSIAEAML